MPRTSASRWARSYCIFMSLYWLNCLWFSSNVSSLDKRCLFASLISRTSALDVVLAATFGSRWY